MMDPSSARHPGCDPYHWLGGGSSSCGYDSMRSWGRRIRLMQVLVGLWITEWDWDCCNDLNFGNGKTHNGQCEAFSTYFSTFHHHSPACYEPSQVHQQSMSLGLTFNADTIAQDWLYVPSDSMQVCVLFICKLLRSQFWSFLHISYTFILHQHPVHLSSSYCTFTFIGDFFPLISPSISLFHFSFSFLSSPPLLCPPYFDKLNSLTFPNSLFFLLVMHSELFPCIHFGISIHSHMDTLKLPKSCPLHPLAPPQHTSGPSLITPNVPTLCVHSSPPSPSANSLPVSRQQLQWPRVWVTLFFQMKKRQPQ